ncbi:OmpA family protein [Methylobacterium flocculans]|uniref:hypothetical protein n=1 Tax=Methylobacterium flocculans TaxID=2984843 RepID=UPI0021F334E7|nr:hypothetical protein [Methylobacterium sp. FF17]
MITRLLVLIGLALLLPPVQAPASGATLPERDPSYGGSEVTGLYRLLARLNGEPLPLADPDPYPRAGDMLTTGGGAAPPYVAGKPVVCFPLGVTRLDGTFRRKAPALFKSVERALGALASELQRARAASTSGRASPTITLRLIGYSDPTTNPPQASLPGRDGTNFETSLERAEAVREALRRRLGPGFTFEVEGRGHYRPRPTDPADGEGTLEHDRNDDSCATFESGPAGAAAIQATTPAPPEGPGSLRYVASQRRVEFEIVTPVLTHVGHRLTKVPEADDASNDVRLRLFPGRTMPARLFAHEISWLPFGPRLPGRDHPCAPWPGTGSLKLLRSPSSGWVRQLGADNRELPTSRLDGRDTLALRLDVDEVWKREGARTLKAWRVSVALAALPDFNHDPDTQPDLNPKLPPERRPYSYDRGIGMPTYWAVHQRFEALVIKAATDPPEGAAANPVKACLDALGIMPADADKRAAWLRALRDAVLAQLPKDIDGILLHVHRLDRRFRFYDLAPGMVLRPRPTDYDLLALWTRPADPTPILLRSDPVDPCARVPVPRTTAGGSIDPRRVVTGDPFATLFTGLSFGAVCTGTPYPGDSLSTPECRVDGASGTGDENCTKQYRPLTSPGDIGQYVAGTHVRVFAPLGDGEPKSYDAKAPRVVTCPRSGSKLCDTKAWIFGLDASNNPNANHVTILARTPWGAPLDDWRSARNDALPKPKALLPCVGPVECGYLGGGLSLSPAIKVKLNGRDELASLGSGVAHLLPTEDSAACFERLLPAARGWPRGAQLAMPLDVELAGPGGAPLVLASELVADRRDCRLLGLILTHGSRLRWSR